MALAHSSAIITNGLQFYYDSVNTTKSWIGPPTTNSVPSADTMPSWSNYYRTVTSSTFITEFGTTGYRFINQPSWNGVARGISIPSTGTYTFSAWFRYLGGSPSNNGATVYISGWGGGDSAATIDKTKIGIWQRISITLNCTTTSMTFYLISYGGTDNGTGSPDFSSWEVTMPQVEPGSVATPFVSGTRSNTQAIRDLTNNNTITASSLTYNSNGTFTFNGSSNFLDCGNNSNLQQSTAITMFAWVKPVSASGLGNIMSKNANSGYRFRLDSTANALWWYVSGNAVQGGSCPNGVWSHCTVTGDSSGLKAYVNGQLVASNSTAFAPSAPASGNLFVGSYGGAEYFNGDIATAGLYNRALTEAEIRQNFNAQRGRYGV